MTIWNGLTSDGAVVPIQVDDQGRVIAVGSGPDSPLVVDGDYLRPRDPDLGLGTANIDLDADGQATFAGPVISLGDPSSGATSGTRLGSTVQCAAPTSKSTVWAGYVVGTTTPTSTILADGSATFAGDVEIGGGSSKTLSCGSAKFAGGDIVLNTDGSATFNSTLRVGESGSNNSADMRIQGSGADKRGALVLSKADSSATQDGITFQAGGGTSAVIKYTGTTTFNLEYDNPAFYTTTTNAEGATESVYSGPTLDVKDSLTKLIAAMTAIKAAARASGTFDDLKTAINEALTELVPEASPMPTPPETR